MKAGIIAALAAGLLLALPAAPALAINASDVAPCRPGLPQQLRTLKGLFTVHVVCDHVLYEIPLAMLDRDMLLNTEFAALSAGTEKLAPGARGGEPAGALDPARQQGLPRSRAATRCAPRTCPISSAASRPPRCAR